MKTVNVLVPTGFGLNCDYETAHTFALAGALVQRVHINTLIDGRVEIDRFQIMVFGGGFSWGDDHGAGVLQAVRFKTHLGDKIASFIANGNLVLGICNGFQTLVNMGLLPGFGGDYRSRSVALTGNDCGNFRNQWVTLKIEEASPCVFTRGMDRIELPVRHGEGKFFAREPVIQRLERDNQIVLRYAMPDGAPANQRFPFNPNGSVDDIAGICDPTGRIFGLMPHPEAFNHWTNHPDWTRRKELERRKAGRVDPGAALGIRMFQNAVAFMAGQTGGPGAGGR